MMGSHTSSAFTVSSPLSKGCHEQITTDALRTVRLDVPDAAALSATPDEAALIADLQFKPDGDMKDLGGATLLAAVRDNDLKGRSSGDLTQLAQVHGNPDNQDEHCLRSLTQVEPDGSAQAVRDCRTFIVSRVTQALDGLDSNGKPDPGQRTSLRLHLSLRGTIDAALPTYYVRLGQAMHALQDSFAHTYRSADGMQVTVVLDWLRVTDGTLLESRDGPPHLADLDVCDDPDALRTQRRMLATEASEALLRATLDSAKTRDQRLAAVGALLDRYLSYAPGCTFDNQWCQAPESQYQPAKTGCSATAAGPSLWAGLLAFFALRGRARRGRALAVSVGSAVLAAGLLFAGVARAEADSPAAAAAEHAPPPPVTRAVPEPNPHDPSATAWGAYLGLAGSANNPALATTLGVRLHLSKHWTVGLSGEWNPWLSLNGSTFAKGVVNVYGSAILRFPLAYENFNLRTSVSLGASYLLTDLYGAGSGTIGLYVGVSPLSLEWKLSKHFYLIINPLSLALPVPQLKGVPLVYPQYRFSLGFELG